MAESAGGAGKVESGLTLLPDPITRAFWAIPEQSE